ncbi:MULTISPECIES: AMP-binding protein [Rhodomicrobium]|uniref:AMP-binding protein n=1 Tax=Rhodomicrobium TaxID=1068 RepID=UPI000B4AF003|nr:MULTISPECIES: AMP-binding protein [Rhodomicrobium]
MKIIADHPLAHIDLLRAWERGESATALPRIDIDKADATVGIKACLAYKGEPALITWTSGTTGARKGVIIPWQTIERRAATSHELYGGADPLAVVMSLRGQGVGTLMPAKFGSTIIPVDPDSLAEARVLIEQRGVTCLFATIDKIRAMIGKGLVPRSRELQKLVIAGNVLSDLEHRTIVQAFGVPVYNCYGSTETGTIAISDGQTSALRPTPNAAIRIADGLVEVQTDMMAAGWLHGDIPTPDGWYATGDIGYIHDGMIAIEGRRK